MRSNNKCSKRLLNGGNGKRKNNNQIMRKELEKGKRRVTFNPHRHRKREREGDCASDSSCFVKNVDADHHAFGQFHIFTGFKFFPIHEHLR